jgi:hypothetical protein
MPDQKELIQDLISLGKTEEALEQLEQLTSDAILLQARFNGAKKQYNMGLIEFSEWSRTQAQINYSALEMLNAVKNSQQLSGQIQVNTNNRSGAQLKAFISYNELDALAMRSVNAYLKEKGIRVFVDVHELEVGDNLEDFIQRALQENQFIISLISEHSLKDGWVNEGLKMTTILQRFGKSKWIPIALDKKYEDPDFYNQVLDSFDERIKKYKENIKIALERDRDVRSLTSELNRLNALKVEFASTMELLQTVSVADISGNMFELGMGRVLRAIESHNR